MTCDICLVSRNESQIVLPNYSWLTLYSQWVNQLMSFFNWKNYFKYNAKQYSIGWMMSVSRWPHSSFESHVKWCTLQYISSCLSPNQQTVSPPSASLMGGLHLPPPCAKYWKCESGGWQPEPELVWLDSKGVILKCESCSWVCRLSLGSVYPLILEENKL